MSIAGGYYKAVEAADELGMETVQVFTKNNNQWKGKEITKEDVEKFQGSLKRGKVKHTLSHASYLINLASPDEALWKKSVEAMAEELRRAEWLGIPWVVVHPGAYTSSSEEAGLCRIAKALDEVHRQTSGKAGCLLETTAGQGTTLGWKFEHLAEILSQVQQPDRLGVCVDTCHIFAAGYPLEKKKDYRHTMNQLIELVGVDFIQAFHLNDSLKPLGSRVDRHAHIGHGCLGLEPFRHLLNDADFRHVPMYLETEKSQLNGVEWDAINLKTLRNLVKTKN